MLAVTFLPHLTKMVKQVIFSFFFKQVIFYRYNYSVENLDFRNGRFLRESCF